MHIRKSSPYFHKLTKSKLHRIYMMLLGVLCTTSWSTAFPFLIQSNSK